MLIEWVADIAKLGLFVACIYAALHAYARRAKPYWTQHLTKRRLAVIGMLTLAVSAVKLIEDVVAKESGPVDEAILRFVRSHVSSALNGFFSAVTLSGSTTFLLPVVLVAVLALLVVHRRFEAGLLAASSITALLVVYALKAAVGRARPALWETQWYWGSSFPSGHTLSTAAISTAAALCLARIWPRFGTLATWVAILWTCLVAVSRLVLGVRWPSDVLAAFCVGVFIPLAISVAFDLRHRSSTMEERSPE